MCKIFKISDVFLSLLNKANIKGADVMTQFGQARSKYRAMILGIRMVAYAMVIATASGFAAAATIAPPDDPTQSITYWKPHTLSAEQDALAAKAQDVFSILLRAWDGTRLEPSLYVVESSAGPWAASLADGNILLSRAAIETCLTFGRDRAEHLLAFVLAHELAHQRADDLWHQRFFRLIGNQSPDARQKMLRGLQLDKTLFSDVEQKEAQADHDGLIMMTSVGYDPYQILDKKDFFTAWVENIWQSSCSITEQRSAEGEACKQAQTRSLRARAQLATVATQATLYELGVQAFVAGRFSQARRFFKAYGRDYPSRAVLTSLGLTHLAQALHLQNQLIHSGAVQLPEFYYPLLLDAKAAATPVNAVPPAKRGSLNAEQKQQRQQVSRHLKTAVDYFEKAIRLEPQHEKTYLMLAMAYLIDGNTYMARGVVQGQFTPKFGGDLAADLILAMTRAMENDTDKAQQEFTHIIAELGFSAQSKAFPPGLLIYTAYFNSAAVAQYTNNPTQALQLWKNLARQAKSHGNGFLFQLAIAHINKDASRVNPLTTAPQVNGRRLGDTMAMHKEKAILQSELWLEGEQYYVFRQTNGSRFVVNDRNVITNAWQSAGNTHLAGALALGDDADRPLKSLGIPDRRMHLMSGEYLAYDDYGLAVHIDNNKVAGWFLY
jgi:tetratricopeptide (TPR) repeat protein